MMGRQEEDNIICQLLGPGSKLMVELAGLRVCEACDGTYNQLKIWYCAEVNVDDVDTHLYCWYLMSDI